MTKFTTLVIVISLEIILLGYGVYGLVDRGPWVLLFGAGILSTFWCLRAGVPRHLVVLLHVSLAVSIASAWGIARTLEVAVFTFAPGLVTMFLGGKILYSAAYDPVGHPLLWGLATAVNTGAWYALLRGISFIPKLTRRSSRTGDT